MKIHREDGKGGLQVSSYGDGYIEIGEQRHTQSISLVGRDVLSHKQTVGPSSLSFADLEHLLQPRPEVILLGTGPSLTFPDMRIVRQFHDMGIGCDVMDSGAACRTYNILTGEGRTVAAWLLMP